MTNSIASRQLCRWMRCVGKDDLNFMFLLNKLRCEGKGGLKYFKLLVEHCQYGKDFLITRCWFVLQKSDELVVAGHALERVYSAKRSVRIQQKRQLNQTVMCGWHCHDVSIGFEQPPRWPMRLLGLKCPHVLPHVFSDTKNIPTNRRQRMADVGGCNLRLASPFRLDQLPGSLVRLPAYPNRSNDCSNRAYRLDPCRPIHGADHHLALLAVSFQRVDQARYEVSKAAQVLVEVVSGLNRDRVLPVQFKYPFRLNDGFDRYAVLRSKLVRVSKKLVKFAARHIPGVSTILRSKGAHDFISYIAARQFTRVCA